MLEILVFDLPFEAKNLSCIDIESQVVYISLHCILWLLTHVGGPGGPSSFKPANAECVAIGECSKDVYNHLVYCKISDDIAVDSESKLLLTRAGRWFSFRHYKSSKMIFYLDIFLKLNRHSYFRHF